jgi:hypothetical protein
MSKAIDREVQARNNRVMRSKLYGKTVDIGAWKSHRESWVEQLERYEKIKDEMQKDFHNWINDKEKHYRWKRLNIDIEICQLQINTCDNHIKIAELIKKNMDNKTNLM